MCIPNLYFRTYLAGQIARACAVFQVDEVIIFDESGDFEDDTKGEFTGVKKKGNPNQTLGRILRKESNYFNVSKVGCASFGPDSERGSI